MPCPYHVHLERTESDDAIDAVFKGPLDELTISMFNSLADAVRAARKPLTLDIRPADNVSGGALPGFLAVAQAVSEAGVAMRIFADGRATELLAQAGLTSALGSGP